MNSKAAARLERRKAALALRPSLSPSGPAAQPLRVATWNLNSLRARLAAVERFLERARPDIVCLQETKAPQLSELAVMMFERQGYRAAHVGRGSYNGVAVVARHPIGDIRSSGDFDDEHLDREARVTSCIVRTPTPLRVVSVYVPHGRAVDHWHYHYKLSFLGALAERVRHWLLDDTHVIVAGDIAGGGKEKDRPGQAPAGGGDARPSLSRPLGSGPRTRRPVEIPLVAQGRLDSDLATGVGEHEGSDGQGTDDQGCRQQNRPDCHALEFAPVASRACDRCGISARSSRDTRDFAVHRAPIAPPRAVLEVTTPLA